MALNPTQNIRRYGPFSIMGSLGSGGMGVVYLAQDTVTNRQVALKTLRSVHADLNRMLRQEIHILKDLRHSGVVQLLDSGFQDGIAWYAMEMLEGQTLGHTVAHTAIAPDWDSLVFSRQLAAVERVPPGAMSGGEAAGSVQEHGQHLHWILQLCRALAYMHGEGVVHGDLKPDNVWIHKARRAVLMDFGLARRFGDRIDRQVVMQAGRTGGTPIYIAPEQIQGHSLDARADLYALGCMLYETLCGRPPFDAWANTQELLYAHLALEPPRLSALAPTVPKALADVVMALLSKSPADRPSHVQVVIDALQTLQITAPAVASDPVPRVHLNQAPLLGRDAQMRRLEQALHDTADGHGGFVLLRAESGLGKTRLAAELVAVARQNQFHVLSGESRGRAMDVFLEPLRQVADVALQQGPEAALRWFGPHAATLASFAPFIGALPGIEIADEHTPLPTESAKVRLSNALIAPLEARFEQEPLLIVLDDLHHLDDFSFWMLKRLVAACTTRPWMILGLCRSDARLEGLASLSSASIELTPLDDEHVVKMVESMLGVKANHAKLVSLLNASASGNPFFISQYLHLALEHGLLKLTPQGSWALTSLLKDATALPTPESLLDLITERMEMFSALAWSLCDTIAVLGHYAPVALLRRACGLDAAHFEASLAELLRSNLVSRSGQKLAFKQAFTREAVLKAMSPQEKVAIHRRTVKALKAQGAERFELPGFELARHLEGAQYHREACQQWRQVAQEARQNAALTLASRALKRALALLPDGRGLDSAQLEAELAKVSFLQGHGKLAAERWQAVLEHTLELGDQGLMLRGRVLLDFGCDWLLPQGRNQEALEVFEEALDIAQRCRSLPLELDALEALANYKRSVSLYDEARTHLEQILELADPQEHAAHVAEVHHKMGLFHHAKGHYEQAVTAYQRALGIRLTLRDPHALQATLTNLGGVYRETGRIDEAERSYRQAQECCHQHQHVRAESIITNNLGNLHAERAQYTQAISHYHRSLKLYRAIGDLRNATTTLYNLANANLRQGNIMAAMGRYEQARQNFVKLGSPSGQGLALQGLAHVYQKQGLWDKARLCAERALALHQDAGDSYFVHTTQGRLAWLDFHEGHLQRASQYALESLDSLRSMDVKTRLPFMLRLLVKLRIKEGRLNDAQALANELMDAVQDNPHNEADARVLLAQLARMRGHQDAQRAHLRAATELYKGLDAKLSVAFLGCELAHLALDNDRDPTEHLQQARVFARMQALGVDSPLGRDIASLERLMASLGGWAPSGQP